MKDVINLVGKTNTRQFVQLMYHAAGVVCPVTFAMHLAAAVPTRNGRPRPCVVIAGGREPVHWEKYPGHTFLHTVGQLDCCKTGGCWKSLCQPVGDGDSKDQNDQCELPAEVRDDLRIPQCMHMIDPAMVVSAIENYTGRGAAGDLQATRTNSTRSITCSSKRVRDALRQKRFSVLIGCYGDYPQYSLRAVQSVVQAPHVSEYCDVHVSLAACSTETIQTCRRLKDERLLASLFESTENINKDAAMRLLMERSTSPYVLWMDDDSHFVSTDWPQQLDAFIAENEPFDAAGHVFFHQLEYESDNPFWKFVQRKPWWTGRGTGRRAEDDPRIFFPTGGMFLASLRFCRQHGFPDYAMVKRQDDIVFGELLNQTQGRLISFSKPIMDRIKISDGNRRGEGEAVEDLRDVNPRTGFANRRIAIQNKVTGTSPIIVHGVSPVRSSAFWQSLLSLRHDMRIQGHRDIAVLTVNTRPRPCLVEEQFARNGEPIQVLGTKGGRWSPRQKLIYLRDALAHVATEYALLLDGFDVLVHGRLGQLIDVLDGYESQAMFNAERVHFPMDASSQKREQERAPLGTPFVHLNAGVCFGRTRLLEAMYDRFAKASSRATEGADGEQYFVKGHWCEFDGVTLDYFCRAMHCCSFGRAPERDLAVHVMG